MAVLYCRLSFSRFLRINQDELAKVSVVDPALSRQIEVIRVVCIFFMMSVHVNPALDWGLIDGFWGLIGFFWTDVLGRASVATLSLISGYLLAGSISRKKPLKLIGDRLKAIYVPMVLWNAVFMLSVLAAGMVIGARSASFFALDDTGLAHLVFERLLNFRGAPAVQALAFLRDLLVCSVILVVAVRLLGRRVAYILPLIAMISLHDMLEPVVYRPNILLFMAVGVALRQRAVPLGVPATWRVPVLAGLCLTVVVRFAVQQGIFELEGVLVQLENLALRVALTLAILDLSALLIHSRAAKWLLEWEPHVFLAYLSHTVVISSLWLVWKMCGAGVELPSYGAFFLLAPVAAMISARLAAPLVTSLPALAQIAIRGKVMAASARARPPRGGSTAPEPT